MAGAYAFSSAGKDPSEVRRARVTLGAGSESAARGKPIASDDDPGALSSRADHVYATRAATISPNAFIANTVRRNTASSNAVG